MKAFRISGSILALAALSLLAACGGGGGGGSNTVPNPGNGGGGGGSTPTPATSSTPSTTPTPAQTSSPGGTAAVDAGLVISASEDQPNGNFWFTSGTASWANTAGDASTSTAPTSTGATFEGMTCADTTEGTSFPAGDYSQHAFVGFFNSSGIEQALPQALGMIKPVAPTQGTPSHPSNTYEVENYQCEYNVHTHDYSGLVHIEDTGLPQTESYTFSAPYASLKALLDLWGATLNSSGITAGGSSLSGAVTIYVGTPSTKTASGADLVNSYTVFNGDPSTLMLTRHEAIWIVVGTTADKIPPLPGQTTAGTQNGLPEVKFTLTN